MDEQIATIDNLNSLAWEMRLPDVKRSLALSDQAYLLAARLNYKRGVAQSLRNKAEFGSRQSKYDEALTHAHDALQQFRELNDAQGEAETLNIIGNTYRLMGNATDALIYFLRAQDMNETLDDKRTTADTLNYIGMVYSLQINHATAMTYFEQSQALYRDLDYPKGVADTLDNCGASARELGDYRRGLEYCLEALEIYLTLGDKQGQAEVISTIGEIYIVLEDFEQAISYFETAREISAEIDNTFQETRALLNIANLYQIQEDYSSAIHAVNQAMQTGAGVRQQLCRCHHKLAEMYKAQGRLEDALSHYEQYVAIKDEVFNQESEQRIKNLKTAHEVEMHQLRNKELQNEIHEHEQLINDLDAYAHMVAHDLKGPSAVIMGYTDMLITDLEEIIDDESKDMLKNVYRASEKMQHIIEELLILASIRKDSVMRYPLDMDSILSETQHRLRELLDDNKATIKKAVEVWPSALGYTPWVEEIWVNFFSNAIKYGGKPPVITVGADTTDEDMIRFWIQDNGTGIKPDKLKEVFQPFKRLDEHKRLTEGHGLGLSIVKRIVEKLGGEVGVQSANEAGQGAVFSFTLPVVETTDDELEPTTRLTVANKSTSAAPQPS